MNNLNTLVFARLEPIIAADSNTKVEFHYIQSLDGVRAIAVLLVFFYHAILIFPAFNIHFNNGFLGVDIFFVLSGFLITSILLKEFDETQTINFKNFYARRFLRLTPAYWTHLAILFLFATYLFTSSITDILYSNQNFVYAIFYLTNWQRALHGSDITGLLSHTWSLAIEEQFYLIWTFFLFLLLRRMKRFPIVLITAGIILGTALLRAYQWQGERSVDLLYNAFNSRMDALLVGCLVGQLTAWKFLPKNLNNSEWFNLLAICSLFIIVMFLLYTSSYSSAFLYQGGFTIFALAVGVLIIWLTQCPKNLVSNILKTQPLVWLGKTSYGIYLWHSLVIAYVNQFSLPSFAKISIAIILTLIITSLCYYLIEQSFLKLKTKFH